MKGHWEGPKGNRRYVTPVKRGRAPKKGWRNKKGNTKRWPTTIRGRRCFICNGSVPRGRHDTCSYDCREEKIRRAKLHNARVQNRRLLKDRRRLVVLPKWITA